MKTLIKFVVILGAFFTATLLIFKFADLFTVEDIKFWLSEAQKASHWVVGGIIVGLMLIDLFVAIPTLSLTILSGFFLGLELGLFYSSIGMLGAGSWGYFLSKYKGDSLLKKLTKDYSDIEEMKQLFNKYGPISLTLCRAAPMLPEVTSCLAGVTNMPYRKYLLFYTIGTIPFAAIAVYAGSISTVDNPEPGFIAFGSVFGFLTLVWIGFLILKRKEFIKR